MKLEEKLTALLRTIVPNTFCDFAPVGTELPYCTYQQVGGEAVTFIDNTVPSKENAHMQINIWGTGRLEVKGLMQQVEAALTVATDMQARPLAAPVADFDADMQRYGARQDFSIWADR